jgi:hypothetical protein
LHLECLEDRFVPSVDVLTYHNDNARTGWNSQETILNPADVNSATFGLLYKLSVDGKVDATPLYMSNLAIPGQGTHNVVFVATEHDSLYAFDADTGTLLWHDGPSGTTTTILPAGEVPSDPVHGSQVFPEIGITATPVIDPATNTIYIVAMSKLVSGTTTTYHQRIHALDVTTGAEKVTPVEITASFPGTGDNSSGGFVHFDPKQYKERDALLLLNGVVYTSWASHSDVRPYTAWVMGYDAATLDQVSVLNVVPNGSEGAFWNSGAGPAADADGNFYNLAGNGTFDTTLDSNGFPINGNYGNAFIKFSPSGGLHVADYFNMHNTIAESNADEDLGSGGVIVLPDMTDSQGQVQHLAIGAGKDGNIYIVDRDNMGKFNPQNDNAIYQEVTNVLSGGEWATSAYFNDSVYFGPVGNHLKQFTFTNAVLGSAPTSQSANTFVYPGTTPSVSSNGTDGGIVWASSNDSTAVLYAYDANDLSVQLYSSNQAGSRDHFGTGNKFITPMIADGKVFVGVTDGVGVFGLIAAPPAPTNLNATESDGQVFLTWTGSPGAVSYNIYRGTTSGGEDPTPLNSSPITGTSFTNTSIASGTAYYYIVTAVNPFGEGAASNEASVTPLPPGWTAKDIGNPGEVGGTSFDGTTWTVSGGGSDIWGNADQFQYAYQSVSGDATIIAQVTSISDTSDWAKAGVMFRDGTDPGAAYVGVFMNPNGQVEMQWRDTAGGASDWNGSQVGDTGGPKWVKIVRSGDTFTAYYAETTGTPTDSDWIAIGSRTIAMSSATAGLAVSAGDNTQLATATFTNVSISGG